MEGDLGLVRPSGANSVVDLMQERGPNSLLVAFGSRPADFHLRSLQAPLRGTGADAGKKTSRDCLQTTKEKRRGG